MQRERRTREDREAERRPCSRRATPTPKRLSRAGTMPLAALAAAAFAACLGTGRAEARETFSAPSGDLGANLSTNPSQRARAHTELSYFTASSSTLVTNRTDHALTLKLGFGTKIADHFELALSLAGEGLLTSGTFSTSHYAIGNLLLGGNYAQAFGPLRLKLGLAVGFGPWNQNAMGLTTEGLVQATTGGVTHGYQDAWYFEPRRVSVVVPTRLELDVGDQVVVTADVQPALGIGLNSTSTGVLFIFAPGLAFWPADEFALGFRLPVQIDSLAADSTQTAFEPFLRFDLGNNGFVGTRFTINLDEPLGFSFDSGKFWGWHLAVGADF